MSARRELIVFVSKLKQKYFSKRAVALGNMKIFGKRINETEINGKKGKCIGKRADKEAAAKKYIKWRV